jgi:type II secretory pathway component PulF
MAVGSTLAVLKHFHSYMAVSGQELGILFRSLAVAFNSGVPLGPALQLVSRQTENQVLADTMSGVCKKVESGRYLSNAFSSYPHVFTPMHVRLVAVGEKSGRLGQILLQLADLEDRQTTMRLKIRNSLTMPILVSTLCILMVALAPPLLFRGLLEMLQSSGTTLPWPTRLLIFFSDSIRSGWFYLVGGGLAALGLLLVYRTLTQPHRRFALQSLLLTLPVIGPGLRTLAVTRFAEVLAVLHAVGMPLLQALKYSAEASDDPCMIKDMDAICAAVNEGELLGDALSISDFFPPTFCHAVRAGEESGGLGDMLKSMANLYRVELEHKLEIVTKSLEPLMLAFVGSIVCFTVIATLLPMLKVIESL